MWPAPLRAASIVGEIDQGDEGVSQRRSRDRAPALHRPDQCRLQKVLCVVAITGQEIRAPEQPW